MPIHLKVNQGDIAERVVVAGDPARVEYVSEKFLDEPRLVNTNRGLTAYTGKYRGVEISIVTHGMGTPSALIVLEELIQVGAKAVVRLGSCGAMVPGMKIGDVVIPTGASYYPGGAFYQYYKEQICAPAVPDFSLLRALADTAEEKGLTYKLGPVLSSDAFYAEDPDFAKKWASRGVIAVEMECAGIFSIGLMRGIKVASLLLVSDSLVEDLGFADAKVLNKYADKAAEVVLEALTKVKV